MSGREQRKQKSGGIFDAEVGDSVNGEMEPVVQGAGSLGSGGLGFAFWFYH